MLGISPHGAITFVSSLYTGSISDKEITRCSGILDLLEPTDSVMADKSFDIESVLESHGVKLNLLPFLEARDQFSKEQVLDTKTIAKLCIHEEWAIRRMKEFHIFDRHSFKSFRVNQPNLYCHLSTCKFPRTSY